MYSQIQYLMHLKKYRSITKVMLKMQPNLVVLTKYGHGTSNVHM